MGPGEEKTFTIPADEAYGPHRDELVMEIARAQLPAEAKPTVGQRYTVRGDNGQVTEFTLTSLSDTTATFDGNHPLAGHDLTFNIQLVEIV
jgi:peptidylprolyl isomerase